jgi:hypothetical protein
MRARFLSAGADEGDVMDKAGFRTLAFLLLVVASGCHGGSSFGTPIPGQNSSGFGAANINISVPAAAAGGQREMQSVIVSLLKVNGITPAISPRPVKMNLAQNAHGCTMGTGGTLNCVARIQVPAGSDTFSIITYAFPNISGAQVTNDQVTMSIAPQKQTNCIRKQIASL